MQPEETAQNHGGPGSNGKCRFHAEAECYAEVLNASISININPHL
jgi:hypothetical protein